MGKCSFRFARRAFTTSLAAFLTVPANAGSSNGTIAVSLTISDACAVNGGSITSGSLGQIGAISFANQPGIFGDVDAAMIATGGGGAISVLCSPGLTPQLTIGTGDNDSNNLRHLASGSNEVAYRLYSDSGRTNEITIGQQLSLGTATTTAFEVPIYARVNSEGAVLPGGSYTDTVQVTLAW
ncbi:MAG: spore coat U domain-containing protein [Thermomicrobiales bacterium]